MRNAVNRVLTVALLGALLFAAVIVGIEAVARLTGSDGPVGPVDYEGWWRSMQDWHPGRAAATWIFVGVAVLGLLILLFELWPGRDPRDVVVDRGPEGPVLLSRSSARAWLARRMESQDWVRRSRPRIDVGGARVTRVRDRPMVSRPPGEDDLRAAREDVAAAVSGLGLEPGPVELDPRRDRHTGRVR